MKNQNNKQTQIVTFVIDKDLDIQNQLIALDAYKRDKKRGVLLYKNNFLEELSTLTSKEEIISEIEKSIEKYYKKENKLLSLVDDINKEWVKIEKDFINNLEIIHKFPFPHKSVKGVLSSAIRLGYNYNDEKNSWFATSMQMNKFISIDKAMHEIMHLMFHRYYDDICIKKGLTKEQMWDVKESFSVLLNIEFDNFMFLSDIGHLHNKNIREYLEKTWKENHDFDKTLEKVIEYVLNNNQ